MVVSVDAPTAPRDTSRGARYRLDIDGLRAIAVLAVVLYHVNPAVLPGGYTGVDIFFVISGFLITGLVVNQLQSGSFSFTRFYIRRAKRLGPALIAVVSVTTALWLLFALPIDAVKVGQAAIASLFGVANIYFWATIDTGYFADETARMPLLHLWSLGVEEQFYLVWPAVLLLAWRLGGKKALIGAALPIVVISLWASQALLASSQPFSFYMLPTRAWELAAGALAFLLLDGTRIVSPLLGRIASLLGLVAIAFSVTSAGDPAWFPGIQAVPAVLGTALLLYGGAANSNIVSAIISNKPLRFVGVISYSTYLWHWPIVVSWRYVSAEPTSVEQVAMVALSLMFGWVSYALLESRAFSHSRFDPSRLQPQSLTLRPVAIGLALSLSLGVTAVWSAGAASPWKTVEYQARVSELDLDTRAPFSYREICQTSNFSDSLLTDERCLSGAVGSSTRVLLIGDSNASHYVGFISEVGARQGFELRNATHGSCPAILKDASNYAKRNGPSCDAYSTSALSAARDYETVILAGSWPSYWSEDFRSRLAETIAYLADAGAQVVVAAKAPIFPNYDRDCTKKAEILSFLDCDSTGSEGAKFSFAENQELREMRDSLRNFELLDITDYVCPEEDCSPYTDGFPLYYDPGHLSMEGSRALGAQAANAAEPVRLPLGG